MSEHKLAFAFIFVCGLFGVVISTNAQPAPPANLQDVQIINAPVAETPLTPERFLPNTLGDNWQASGTSKALQGASLAESKIGNVLVEYGTEKMSSRVYAKGTIKHTVEIYGLRTWVGAYGLQTFFGLDPAARSFHAGRYAVRISGDSVDESFDESFFKAVKDQFAEMTARVPNLPKELPKPTGRVHYLFGDRALSQNPYFSTWKESLSFKGGTEVAIAEYENGGNKMHLMLVEYQTPQFAEDGIKALQSLATQPQQLVKRVGNYVIAADQVQDRAAAESLIGQIKYRKEIYWEGKKYSDIPLEYRPGDPAAFAEAAQTANVLLRAFYWIGIMLVSTIALGVISGGGFFYWRRYQRRKKGIEDIFSDAGEAVRLNLDDYLLEPQNQRKQLTGKDS